MRTSAPSPTWRETAGWRADRPARGRADRDTAVEIVRLYVPAPKPLRELPGGPRMVERPSIRIEAFRGAGESGGGASAARRRLTLFSEETWFRLEEELGFSRCDPGVLRRNVIVRGADLAQLVGRRFALQGIPFVGLALCRPCPWMDRALWPGTRRLLAQWRAGGLLAAARNDGVLICDAAPAMRWNNRG